MKPISRTIAALLLAVSFAGCVKRAIIVESDPPGAEVWINEHPKGKAPVTYEFITHGRYRFRLKMPGFRELVVQEKVRAPLHQWIPIDFITEYLLPFPFQDIHQFRYTLTPEPLKEKLEVVVKPDLKALAADLKDPDPQKRRAACVTLAARRDPTFSSEILAATNDSSGLVRAVALTGWRNLQGKQSLERLSKALLYDPDPHVRWQAAVELEALGDDRAVPMLLVALHDRKEVVRTGAAEALKGLADPRALPALIKALKDRNTSVRRAAAEGLGRIGDRSAVPALTKALFHHDFQTRRKAVEALAHLKDPASGPALVRTFIDWDPQVRRIATESLIAFGDERVVPLLIRTLRAFRPWTREHAAHVLGGLKAQQAIEPLRRALAREPNETAAEAMIQALEKMGERVDESIKQRVEAQRARGRKEIEERAKKKKVIR